MTDLNQTVTVIFNVFKDGEDLCISPAGDPNIEYSCSVGANDNPESYEELAQNLIKCGNGFLNKTNANKPPTRYLFERITSDSSQNFQLKAKISF